MLPGVEHNKKPPRRINQAAIACFTVSAIALVACGMGLFVNHMLTGTLAVGGTAAVALIYLAMGLMNLDYGQDTPHIRTIDTSVDSEPHSQPGRKHGSLDVEFPDFAARSQRHVASTRETAVADRD